MPHRSPPRTANRTPLGLRIGGLLLGAWVAGIPVLFWVILNNKSHSIEQLTKGSLAFLLLAAIASIIHGSIRGSRAVIDSVNRTNCLGCGYELSGVAKAHATVCPECGQAAPSYQHDRTYYQHKTPKA